MLYLPFSKHLHLLGCPFNEYFRNLGQKGELTSIEGLLDEDEDEEEEDEDEELNFGVANIEDYTWKDLLDLYSCAECGRCQEVCPAYNSEKPLSPKKLMIDLKHHLDERGVKLLKLKPKDRPEEEDSLIIGEIIKEDEIWACTTCYACVEYCPIFNEQMPKLIDLRRYMVMAQENFPKEAANFFKNLDNNYNPWPIGFAKRADWAKDLEVKTIKEKKKTKETEKDIEYLYWVGCAGAFDERNKKVSEAMIKILNSANISFAILGKEEKCCGDSARRLGNEYAFQMLAMENIEILNEYNIKKIITQCPHCYNTLKNEYPHFDGNYKVIHHTELIFNLLKARKIKIKGKIDNIMCYHDSCYLGRYNDIYEEPRNILKSLSANGNLKEMELNHNKSFCCGAGGGRMWLEETIGKRINIMRAEQSLEIGAELVATACPYCLTMFEDGFKDKNVENVSTKDIAELVAEHLIVNSKKLIVNSG